MSIDTLLSIVGNVTIVVAAGIAIWQLREAARARSLDGFTALAENIKKDQDARKTIYKELANIHGLTEKEKHKLFCEPKIQSAVVQVCVTFDQMGVLVMHGLLPRDVAFSMYFDVILRTWYLVEPFVQEERKRRRSDAWMAYYEMLDKECWHYWLKLLKKHPKWKYMKKPDDIFHYI